MSQLLSFSSRLLVRLVNTEMVKRKVISIQSNKKKLAKMDETRGLGILNLNDDCLISICNYLSIEDIFALHKTHTRFHNAIGASLVENEHEFDLEDFGQDMKGVESFLALFGDRIKRLSLPGRDANEGQFKKLIAKHCNGGNIEHCEFGDYFKIDEVFFANSVSFFKALKSVTLKDIEADITLMYQMLRTMDKLESLDISYYQDDIDLSDFLSIISSYSITKLTFNFFCNLDSRLNESHRVVSVKHLSAELSYDEFTALKYFPNIEYLHVKNCDSEPDTTSLMPITDLLHLRQLHIEIDFVEKSELHSLLEHFAKRNCLEALILQVEEDFEELSGFYDEIEVSPEYDIIQTLGRFTKLTSLRICLPYRFGLHVINLATSLPKLRHLDIMTQENNINAQALACGVVSLAKNLDSLCLRMLFSPRSAPTFYRRMFEKLSTVKESQNANVALNFKILPSASEDIDDISYTKNKWVSMEVGMCM